MASAQLAAERYALLVRQLGEELGFGHGWKSAVARRLGVHPSYVSRVEKGDRTGIGGAVVARAIEALNLDRSFFTAPELTGSYRDFVRPETDPNAVSAAVAMFEPSETLESIVPIVAPSVLRDWTTANVLARIVARRPTDKEIAQDLARFILERSKLAKDCRNVLEAKTDDDLLVAATALSAHVRVLSDPLLQQENEDDT